VDLETFFNISVIETATCRDRSQVVKYVQNHISSATSIISGVPQGTVIGPVAFLSFINDLPEEVVFRLYLFADDTKMYREITTGTVRLPPGL